MVLKKSIKILQSKKASTQYLTIPASMVSDSQYPFKANEEVEIEIDTEKKLMIIAGKNSKK